MENVHFSHAEVPEHDSDRCDNLRDQVVHRKSLNEEQEEYFRQKHPARGNKEDAGHFAFPAVTTLKNPPDARQVIPNKCDEE
jgi:hypothetical protein